MKLTEELAKKIYEITNTDYSDQLQDYEIIDLIEELVNKIDDNISKREEEINNLIIKRKRLLAPLLILATLRRYTSKNNPLNTN